MVYPDNEDPDQQINSTILKLAEEYAASEARSSNENDIRQNIRDNVEKLGIPSKAWQVGVSMAKHMTAGERRDHEVGLKRVLGVLDEVAPTLWPEDIARTKKREDKKNAAEAEAKTKAGPDADSNPRSDPNAGGAKPMTGDPDKPWPDDVATGTVQNPPGEAEAGDEALNAALPETKGKKRSQSAIAAEKAAAAGTDQPITVN